MNSQSVIVTSSTYGPPSSKTFSLSRKVQPVQVIVSEPVPVLPPGSTPSWLLRTTVSSKVMTASPGPSKSMAAWPSLPASGQAWWMSQPSMTASLVPPDPGSSLTCVCQSQISQSTSEKS